MAILAPVVFALLPLLVLPGVVFYYDITPKIAVLLFGTAAALLFFRENRRGVLALLGTRAGRLFAVFLAAQQVSLIVSTVLSDNPSLSLGGTNWRRFGLISQSSLVLLTLLTASHFTLNRRVLTRSLGAIACAGCAMAAYGILQYFGFDPLLPPASYHAGEGVFQIVRPPGTMGHAAYFATYLLCALAAGVALLPTHRAIGWSACALITPAIILSGTRASILGLLVGAILLVLLWRPPWRAVVAAAALACCAIAILWVTPAGGKLRARARWSVEDLRGGARLLLWRDSLQLVKTRLWTGTGLETFGSAFPPHQSVELSRAYPDFYHESPHNILLDAVAAQGLPGLTILLAICGWALIQTRRSPPLVSGIAAALVSLQFTSFTIATASGFLVLIAAGTIRSGVVEDSEPGVAWRIVSVLFAIVLAAAGIRLVVADRHLQLAKSAFDAGRIDEAVEQYRFTSSWAWPGGTADLYCSRRLASAGRLQEAIEAGLRAIKSAEDRQNAFYSLAALHAATGDETAVEADLKAATSASPQWFKPHWTLAQLYSRQRKLSEAEKEATLAVDLDGDKHPEVGQTLARIRADIEQR